MRSISELRIFWFPKIYCFIISLLAAVHEIYNLIRDQIKYGAIFVNYNIIAQFTLAIYGVTISIYLKSKSGSIARLIWWIPQILIVNKVMYSLQSVAKSDAVFDLSLLFKFGFSTGFKDEYDIYTMVQINIIAAIGIVMVLVEREKVNQAPSFKLEAERK